MGRWILVVFGIVLLLVVGGQLGPLSGAMADPGITLVQGPTRGTATSGASSLLITLSSTPTQNDLMVATANVNSAALSGITETGVTWTHAVVLGAATCGTPYSQTSIWYGVAGSGASSSITASFSGALTPNGIAIVNVAEYSGLATTNVVDTTAMSGCGESATSSTGTTGTTLVANELVIGSISAINTHGFSTAQTAPTGTFTTLYDGVDTVGGVDHYSNAYLQAFVSATGPQGGGTTIANPSYWDGVIATFVTFTTLSTTIPLTIVSTTDTTTAYDSSTTYSTVQSSPTSTITSPTVVVATVSTTSTTSGPTTGSSTTISTSLLSTSYSTSTSLTSTGETTSESSVTSTTSSTTTTSTSTSLTTTSVSGTVTVTETDTFYVLLTSIEQDVTQVADQILQALGMQVTATPVAQQVNEVIVTLVPATSTTYSSTITVSTTTTSFTSTTTSPSSILTTTSTLSATTLSPKVTKTVSTKTTTTGTAAGTSTTTFTSILTTSTGTSTTTISMVTATSTSTATTGTSSASSTSSTMTLSTTTVSGTVTVSQTNTVTVFLTTIFQALVNFANAVMKVVGMRTVATPKGQKIIRVVVTKK